MKKIWVLLSAVFLVSFCLTACGNRHKITIPPGTDLIVSCPKSAKEGDRVEVETVSVTDGWLEISGVNGEFEEECLYVFTMPDHDVRISVSVVSNWMA